MSAVNIGLMIAGVGAIIFLAIIIKGYYGAGDGDFSSSDYDEDDEGISEEGCRDVLLLLVWAALVVVGLLISLIAWIVSLF